MKNSLTFALMFSLNLAAFAQTDSLTMPRSIQFVNGMPEDGVFLQNNKVMKIENGKVMELEMDMKLNDQSTISKMGTIQREDGSTMQLMEGDFLKKNGMLVPGPKRDEQSK